MSDRTPADALARARWDRELDPDHPWHVAWDDVSPRVRQEQVEFAEADIELLAAAGFRVSPIPDDNTRALAARLREWHAAAVGDCSDHDVVLYDDLLTAAAYLDGQPQDRPDRCPTCGSADIGPDGWVRRCPHSWHVGGSGDTP